MKGTVAEPGVEALPADRAPPATQTARRRPNQVVERKLDELDACLAEALTSRPRRTDVDGSLFAEIHHRTDFLRSLIAAERECHGGARLGHLVEAEERFGVLKRTFEQWAVQSGIAAATEKEEPDQVASASGSGSGSGGCSCTGSCFGFEFTGQEAAFDAKCDPGSEAAEDHNVASAAATTEAIEVPPATRTAARRHWWKRRAAFCWLAGVVAVVALGAGLALEFATVAQQSVYVVPT